MTRSRIRLLAHSMAIESWMVLWMKSLHRIRALRQPCCWCMDPNRSSNRHDLKNTYPSQMMIHQLQPPYFTKRMVRVKQWDAKSSHLVPCHSRRKFQMVRNRKILFFNLSTGLYTIHLNPLVHDCLRYMQEGSDFLKVRSYARQFRRFYRLNDTLTAITWFPTSKKPTKAMSRNIVSISRKKTIMRCCCCRSCHCSTGWFD